MTRAARIVTAVALAAAVTGCSKTNDVTCPPGFGLCAGVCLSISDDAQNCGACGNACGAGQACVASACVQDCRAGLRAPIVDRWGTWWDGLERPLASLADATAACRGRARYVPKVGSREPYVTARQWTFRLRKAALDDDARKLQHLQSRNAGRLEEREVRGALDRVDGVRLRPAGGDVASCRVGHAAGVVPHRLHIGD